MHHRYKLETTFQDDDGSVVHTTDKADESSATRGESVTWIEKRVLGSGGFGRVTLQENTNGNLRAVKQLMQSEGSNYVREITALAMVSDVRILVSLSSDLHLQGIRGTLTN